MMVDGFFVFGIVVVVLGIIKIMGVIIEFLVVFGKMIGGVLVGMFFGVFLVYGFVVFIVLCFGQIYLEEVFFYYIICDVLVFYFYGNVVQIFVEVGCGSVLIFLQLLFLEFEEVINEILLEVGQDMQFVFLFLWG